VWGTAEPGEELTVFFNGQKAPTKANKDGKWSVMLAPTAPGGPFELSVKGKNNRVEIKEILVGDVWIASGQSNMEWELSKTRDPKEVIANSKNPRIRLFDVPRTPKSEPQSELGSLSEKKNALKNHTYGKWLECGPDTAAAFSAVGYYFGRALERDLKVPIGIINSSWGGTAAERWISKPLLESNEDLKGANMNNASNLYNGMIVPLQPFAIRGVIWYQGESNAGNAKRYYHLMNALIKNWRSDWKQGEFPFLTVQLAPYETKDNWPELREAQLFTSLKMKNTAMAVITDSGDPKDIHPKDKLPVGERLALAARAIANGQDVEYIGPLYDGVKFEKDKAMLTFKHIGGGLQSKGGPLTGFTIAGADGKFVKADAAIVDNTVVVRSADVAQPTAVRYAWANYPTCNLYNREGLPATPFRTDVPDYYK
jgi:sialate O-acetylesterase